MTRRWIAVGLLALGAGLSFSLHRATSSALQETGTLRERCVTQRQVLWDSRTRLTALQAQARELKAALKALPAPAPAQEEVSALMALRSKPSLTPEESERLRAALGFTWDTTGDYLIVSKECLQQVSLEGIERFQVSEVAGKILEMTPGERAAIDATIHQLAVDYGEWAKANVKQGTLGGEVVASYSLPADPEFCSSLSNRFVNTLEANLGAQRGQQMNQFAYDWLMKSGFAGSLSSSLIVKRVQNRPEPSYLLDLTRPRGGNMVCGITPLQPFPENYRVLFPGGWEDLAAQAGFELPPEFKRSKQP